MALVVFLRGLNVGGHRRFRPAELARQLRHLDTVNIGATGTLVIRRPVGRARLRSEIKRRLSVETEIMMCDGREILRLMARDVFSGRRAPKNIVHFGSVLGRRPRSAPRLPLNIPATGQWFVQVLERDGPFVIGRYRRHMRTIGYLGKLDRVFGVPATTRSWSTLTAVARVLKSL